MCFFFFSCLCGIPCYLACGPSFCLKCSKLQSLWSLLHKAISMPPSSTFKDLVSQNKLIIHSLFNLPSEFPLAKKHSLLTGSRNKAMYIVYRAIIRNGTLYSTEIPLLGISKIIKMICPLNYGHKNSRKSHHIKKHFCNKINHQQSEETTH